MCYQVPTATGTFESLRRVHNFGFARARAREFDRQRRHKWETLFPASTCNGDSCFASLHDVLDANKSSELICSRRKTEPGETGELRNKISYFWTNEIMLFSYTGKRFRNEGEHLRALPVHLGTKQCAAANRGVFATNEIAGIHTQPSFSLTKKPIFQHIMSRSLTYLSRSALGSLPFQCNNSEMAWLAMKRYFRHPKGLSANLSWPWL